MAAPFSYNGVSMNILRTNLYERRYHPSQDGTDRLYVEHILDITTVYNKATQPYADAPAIDNALREKLMEPRKALMYQQNGQTVLQSPIAGMTTDAKHGPEPIACTVHQLTGAKTWIVQYRIRTWLIECTGDPINLTSNRWKQAHQIGVDKLTTCITTGVAVFRRDALAKNGAFADDFRNLIIPPMPGPYFQRMSIELGISESGLELFYQVVDKERYFALGDTSDATRLGVEDFKGRQTFTSTPPAEKTGVPPGYMLSTLQASVVGGPATPTTNLITWLLQLTVDRLALPAGPVDPSKNGLLQGITISKHLDENRVDLEAIVLYPPQQQNAQGLGSVRTDLLFNDAVPLLNKGSLNPQMPNDGNTRGSFTGEVLAQKIADACTQPTLPTGPRYAPGAGAGASAVAGSAVLASNVKVDPPVVVVSLGVPGLNGATLPPAFTTAIAATDATDGWYTDYHVEMHYDLDPGVLVSPRGGTATDLPAVMKVHSPVRYLTVEWTAERVANYPQVPHPRHNDTTVTLIHAHVGGVSPILGVDNQTRVYRVSGVYKYVVANVVSGPGLDTPLGALPWYTYQYGDNVLPAGNYVHGIIDNSVVSGPAPPPRFGAGTPAGNDF